MSLLFVLLELSLGNFIFQESSRKFFTFGPFDQYKQSQDLFQSHFDLYTAKKFHKRANDITDDNAVLHEAQCVEMR